MEFQRNGAGANGFTLIEMITAVTIAAILASVAIPKLFNKNDYAVRAFFDDTLTALRYAQKLAVATGCNVQVSVSSNQYSLMRRGTSTSTACPSSGAYSLAVINPSTGESGYSGSEPNVTLSSSVSPFVFHALGSASADVVLTVNGNQTIQVVATTGLVYDSTP